MKHSEDIMKSFAKALLAGSATIGLVACGGGGGDKDNPTLGETSNDFTTSEFRNTEGLDQINADAGYVKITGAQGGAGVRVAVIDDGIDVNHPDLNVVATAVFDGEAVRPGPHGTTVAGIIAARKNDNGMHGVAFNANIVNIQAAQDVSLDFPVVRVASAIDAAAGLNAGGVFEADIMNLSLGGPVRVDVQLDAMRRAADADKIMVFAAGNRATDDPEFPGFDVIDDEVQGLGIVVVSVDSDNDLSSFSAECGDAADFCLAAPGEDIFTTTPGGGFDDETDFLDGEGVKPVTGTSFAAPFVAGAAAVVKAAFPGVSNREVVNRLLVSARDIGSESDFGQGLLDLENALEPAGNLGLATTSSLNDDRASATRSTLNLGNSLVMGGNGAGLLSKAVAFDEQGFPFGVDLNQNFDVQKRETSLSSFVGSDKAASSITTTPYGEVMFAMAEDVVNPDPYTAEFAPSDTSLQPEPDDPRVSFSSEMTGDVSMFLALNNSSETELDLSQALADRKGRFFQLGAFLAPFDRLAAEQSGGGVVVDLGQSTKLAMAAFTAADDEAQSQAAMQKIDLSHKTYGDVELRLSYGWLQEEGGFLGSESVGAFGDQTSADSQYLNVSLLAPVTDKIDLFGSYTRGQSSISSGTASLLDDWSSTQSEAFGVGVTARDVIADGDGLSFMVGQPLRAIDASATLTVPTGRTEDGEVLSESVDVDLSPDGREIATELVYQFGLDDDAHSLDAGTFLRFNPDHDPDADPDVGIGFRYKWSF